MSLTEALLLDPYPFEVWIALRSDGVAGSGTAEDPYDGSVIKTAPLSFTSLQQDSLDPLKAVVTCPSNHGFSTGDLVSVGVPGAVSFDAWDGIWTITVTSATEFNYAMKQVPATNPALLRTIQKLAVFRFDEIMRGLGLNTRVHIGPGTFETRGSPNYYDPARWQVQSGQRITGAGMGLTICAPPSPEGAYVHQPGSHRRSGPPLGVRTRRPRYRLQPRRAAKRRC